MLQEIQPHLAKVVIYLTAIPPRFMLFLFFQISQEIMAGAAWKSGFSLAQHSAFYHALIT